MSDPDLPSIPPLPLPGVQSLFPPNRPPTLSTAAAPPGGPPRRPAMGEVVGEVGRGGVLVVLRERCLGLVRLVGLDFLLTRPLASPGDWPRFLHETRALAHLQYPDVVPFYEVGEHAGQPYFTVNLVEGSLARPWTQTASSPEVALVLARLAKAVHEARQHAGSRKNLHPARVVLDADLVPEGASQGQPEQGERGVILGECLAGWPPSRPGSLGPRTDGDREVVALKCADRAPGRQYASAAELAGELERWLRNEPVQAAPRRGVAAVVALVPSWWLTTLLAPPLPA